MINLGTVRPGSTIYIPFDTFAGSTGASITQTGLAVTDIEVYKDGSMTQRASDAGYTLLDTDGIDLDTITGIHGFSINLADNTTAGFWAAGSRYYVVVSSITVDSQTVNFVAAVFEIGYPDAFLNTTIATLASQTSFTLTSGPAEDDALNGCVVLIHDVASAVQLGFAVVSDYTGSTKTVTLTAGVSFTAAATDNISFYPPSNKAWSGRNAPVAQTGNDDGQDINEILTDTGTTLDGRIPAALVGGRMDANMGAISTDATAADNAEAFFDGTGYAGTGNVIPTVTNLTNAPTNGDLTTTMKSSVNAEVLDVLNVDTFAEIGQEAPAATQTLRKMIGYLYKAWRNKKTQTSTTFSLFADDASTVDQKATVSDDGTTTTIGEVATGP